MFTPDYLHSQTGIHQSLLHKMSLLKEPPILKMAPPGFHIVKRCAKVSKDGIKFFVRAHMRKNRGQKIVLLPENILYLYLSALTLRSYRFSNFFEVQFLEVKVIL